MALYSGTMFYIYGYLIIKHVFNTTKVKSNDICGYQWKLTDQCGQWWMRSHSTYKSVPAQSPYKLHFPWTPRYDVAWLVCPLNGAFHQMCTVQYVLCFCCCGRIRSSNCSWCISTGLHSCYTMQWHATALCDRFTRQNFSDFPHNQHTSCLGGDLPLRTANTVIGCWQMAVDWAKMQHGCSTVETQSVESSGHFCLFVPGSGVCKLCLWSSKWLFSLVVVAAAGHNACHQPLSCHYDLLTAYWK